MSTKRRPRRRTTTESVADLLAFGLGGNAADSETKLRWALDRLRHLFGPLRIAPLYRTAPLSPIPQPDFLNTVAFATLPVQIEGSEGKLDPVDVLNQVKALEKLAGRRDGETWGPRPLDIDLLWFGDLVSSEPEGPSRRGLTLPHPRLRQRRFVLAPLNDLAPLLELPPDGALVNDLLATLGTEQAAEKIDWSPR